MNFPQLTDSDHNVLLDAGISTETAKGQIQSLIQGSTAPKLLRPATRGDGILALSTHTLDALLPAFQEAAQQRLIGFFVPASGAASRMFASVVAFLNGTHPDPESEAEKLRKLARTPIVARNLWAKQISPDDAPAIAQLLVGAPPDGYGWNLRPKAFVPFHEDSEPSFPLRTPLEEQISEASAVLGAKAQGIAHFTLPENWPLPTGFDELCRNLSRRSGGDILAVASLQEKSTDTLALNSKGDLARTEDGKLLLRAGGHGALLTNLAQTPGKVVLVKNIDNIQPEFRREVVVPWRQRLGALALALRTQADLFLTTADSAPLLELATRLGMELPQDPELLRALVDRPLRVASMVANSGEPGGGPFWVAGTEGPRLEIVEQSEVAPEQQELLAQSTHFNPVEMACCLLDPQGNTRPLAPWIDQTRVFRSTKPSPQGPITVLEHPGLWNGSMSGWWTVFVEFPAETFLPAKVVYDLAHPWRLEN